jgi:hypothetical protein
MGVLLSAPALAITIDDVRVAAGAFEETGTSAKLADLGMTVEARDAEHVIEIRKTLEAAGFRLKA